MRFKNETLSVFLDTKTRILVSRILLSKIFLAILAVKIIASFLFSGHVFISSFVPFLEAFVAAPFSNVYETQSLIGFERSFPYPAAMLWLMSGPRLVIYWIGLHELPTNLLLFVYRIPLICADVLIFTILCRWMRTQMVPLMWLYWASPVLFYITYLHGQFDVVPMALALLSTYFLFSHRWLQSAFFLTIGIAAKMHLVLILPFVLVYYWQYGRRYDIVLPYFAIVFVGFVFLNAPYILSDSFVQLVFFNAEQSKVGIINLTTNIDGISFYIIPALVLVLIYYSFVIQIKNRDIFMFFMGATFGVFLLLIPPSQGWYYWFLPYLTYFYVRLSPTSTLPLFGLQASYFAYFALIPTSDFGALFYFLDNQIWNSSIYELLVRLGYSAKIFVGLSFTFLQTMLALNVFSMLYLGVHLKRKSILRSVPFMVGISGASGAGKTTLANCIRALIGKQNTGVICGDDMHKWERYNEKWSSITHLNPLANNLHDELNFITRLRSGKRIWRRNYDHDTGKFTEERLVQSRAIMVLEGLHSFYLKPSRELFDLKIFMKPDKKLVRHRKIIRDMKNRSKLKKDIVRSIEEREKDQLQFIDAQEQYADIIISLLPIDDIPPKEIGNPDFKVAERLQITLSNTYYISQIVSDLTDVMPKAVRHFYSDEDRQVLELECAPSPLVISELGEKYIKGLENFGIYDPDWQFKWAGFLQFFVIYCMFNDWEKRG